MAERGARRCSACKTLWPQYTIFNPSPCCNAGTGVDEDASPDMNWFEAVTRLLTARFERYYEKWNDDVTDEAIMWDESIQDDFPINEKDLAEGMAEIERLIGEPQKTEIE